MFKVLNAKSKTITGGAIIIALTGLFSRLVGLLRDRVLAGKFGAGDVLDAYYAAFKIPDLVFNLLVLGALSAGFIPVFMEYLEKKSQKRAFELANNLFNLLLLSLFIICGILIIFTPSLVPLIAPGFEKEKIKLTIGLTRIMFLSPILLGASNIFGGILQSFKRFFAYSLAPIFYNLGIIIGVLIFVPFLGYRGLALGVVLGAFFHFLIQFLASLNTGFRYRPLLNFKMKGLKIIGKMMVPRTLSLALNQINLLVITIFASTLISGSLAVFNLANNLASFPVGLFGISFAIASFPTLSQNISKGDKRAFIKNFSDTLCQILFFIIPFSILFLLLRAQIVRVVLGTGKFGWRDTILTADALAIFSLGLFAQALLPLLIRSFFAFQDAKTPFLVGLFAASLNIILGFWLKNSLQIVGLVLAFILSTIINLILLFVLLLLELKNFEVRKIIFSLLKISGGSLVMGIVVQGMKYLVEPIFGTKTFLGIFLQGFLAGIVGLSIYFLLLFWFKSEELFSFLSILKRKISKEKFIIEEIDGRE